MSVKNTNFSLPSALRSTSSYPKERRKLQLKKDSSVLLSSPKHGLLGQLFDIKTRHSYSKCTCIPCSPRHKKTDDELVILRASSVKTSSLLSNMLSSQKSFKSLISDASIRPGRRLSFKDDNESGGCGDVTPSKYQSNQTVLSPISRLSRGDSRKHKKKAVCVSPIDKERCGKPRTISPLKKETGLDDLTYNDARYKYKEKYPTNCPPQISKHKMKGK